MAVGDLKTDMTATAATITLSPASGEVWKVTSFVAQSLSTGVALSAYITESATDYELFGVDAGGSGEHTIWYGNVPTPATDTTQAVEYDAILMENTNNKYACVAGSGIFIDNTRTLKIAAASGNVKGMAQAIVVKV
jgi:hypothetical protein